MNHVPLQYCADGIPVYQAQLCTTTVISAGRSGLPLNRTTPLGIGTSSKLGAGTTALPVRNCDRNSVPGSTPGGSEPAIFVVLSEDQRDPPTSSANMNADSTPKWTQPSRIDYSAIAATNPTDLHSAAFTGEEGDIDDVNPAIEAQLFGGARASTAGESLSALNLDVTVESPVNVTPIRKFSDAALHPVVLKNIELCNYQVPTAIQGYCIPAVLQDCDLVAVAQTGSGKTCAYMAPIISKLMGKIDRIGGPRVDTRAPGYDPEVNKVRAEPLVIIVCPTRELAQQIFEESCRLSYRSKIRPVCAYGGMPVKYNIQQLSKGCDILIGTCGRICDLMDKPHVLTMKRVKWTVIEEADEMLNADWEPQIAKIMSGGDANDDPDHRFMMFSATFPKEARALARQYMQQEYVRIRVGRAGSTHKNVTQNIVCVDNDAKRQATFDLLNDMPPRLTIIFCNTVHGVEQLDDHLYNLNLPTTFLHSQRTQAEREDAMRSFRLGKTPILIATALSARGIDFTNVAHVINFDLPSMSHGGIEEYVHRIGRTGRIGHQGIATSFYNERNEDMGVPLVKLLMETDQEIPDFLQQYKPEDGKVDFHDDTDDEDEGGVPAGGTTEAADTLTTEVPAFGAGPGVAATAWGAPPTSAAVADPFKAWVSDAAANTSGAADDGW